MVMLTPGNSSEHHFRRLGISISVAHRPGGKARIDLAIPDDFPNSDFDQSQWRHTSDKSLTEKQRSERRHHLCNQLHIAGMSLDILGRHVGKGDVDLDELESVLVMAVEALTELEGSAIKRA